MTYACLHQSTLQKLGSSRSDAPGCLLPRTRPHINLITPIRPTQNALLYGNEPRQHLLIILAHDNRIVAEDQATGIKPHRVRRR